MSDDWDSDPAPALASSAVVDPWAGEDEEEPIADSWDAEPEEEQKKSGSTAPPPKPKQLSKQKQKKKEEEERRDAERKARDEENDPAARARRKQAEEDAAKERDAFLAADLMGGSVGVGSAIGYGIADDVPNSGASDSAPVVSAADLRPAGTRLEDVTLAEDAECDKIAQMLVKKIVEFPSNSKNSARFLRFFKTLICGPAGDVLRLDEMNELKRLVTVKHTEMTNKQKNQKKKGTTASSQAKPAVKLGTAGKAFSKSAAPYGDDFGGGDYDDDDGDFM